MTTSELAKRSERGGEEALVILEVEGGFRVYAAVDPKRSYLVTGLPEAARCTCPDRENHHSDDRTDCTHIRAVQERFFGISHTPPDAYDNDERRAIQEESQPPRRRRSSPPVSPPPRSGAQMLLKRSMSPDGRIDSLSVEFSCPVENVSPPDIKSKAKQVLGLQAAILADFMSDQPPRSGNGGNGHGSNGNGARPTMNGSAHNGQNGRGLVHVPADGSVPAQMLSIGGMDGRWGRRLFIVVSVNGQSTRLFGNKKQLADALIAAGYGDLAGNIAEGIGLNVPCRVTTAPSPDGRFTNVLEVFPPNGAWR